MKRFLFVAALFVAALFTVAAYMKPQNENNGAKDSRGHVLTELWKQYDEAKSKDRPKKQSEIAKQIVEEAEKQHLAWDFYDGWNSYISAESSINWRTRNDNWKEFAAAAKAFDEPIVLYMVYMDGYSYSGREKLDYDAFVKENAARLKAAHNDAFYTEGLRHEMSAQLPSYISNDYEYVLWRNGDYEALKEYLGESYPNAAYAEYKIAMARKDTLRKEALEAFVKKYDGKAIALYGKGELLSARLNELHKAKAGQDEYKALDQEAVTLEKQRKAFSGSEAKIVSLYNAFDTVHDYLNAKSIITKVVRNELKVFTRNVSRVKLSISESGEKDVLLTKTLDNEKNSFFVYDTLTFALPPMDDGSYVVTTTSVQDKKVSSMADFSRYSISMATRADSKGWGAYIAEQNTGRPIGKADVVLKKNGEEVARVKDFVFRNGFTTLPDEIAKKIKDNSKGWFEIYCSYKGTDNLVKKSNGLTIRSMASSTGERYPSGDYCNVYTDRGAYNPGDTVCFKGVLYSGDLVKSARAAASHLGVEAVLMDSEWNEVEKLKLETNEFGSVAGEFVLPEGLRNGFFSIQLSSGNHEGSANFRVDEFVLPTFSISFDPVKELYLPGDMVKMTGKIESYSGHSIVGADVTYKVHTFGKTVKEGTLVPDADGKFEIEFQSDKDDDWEYYNIDLKVVDGTGETQEAHSGIGISKSISVSASVKNTVDASCDLKVGSASVVADGNVRVELKLRNSYETVSGKVTYEIRKVKGDLRSEDGIRKADDTVLVVSGEAESGEIKDIDMSSFGAGLYYIEAKASVTDNDGKEVKDDDTVYFLMISENDKAIDAPVKDYFRAISTNVETGENMKIQYGTADGTIWAVAELFGENRTLLERRMVNINGKRGTDGSLTELEFEYKDTYPDAVFFQLFYFKNSSSKTFSKEFRRIKHTLDLPLEWESFEDKTLPGREYTFTLKTSPSVEILAAIYDKSVDRINSNYWGTVSMRQFSAERVGISARAGRNSDDVNDADGLLYDDWDDDMMLEEKAVVGYGVAKNSSVRIRGLARASMTNFALVADDAVEMDAAPMMMSKAAGAIEEEAAFEEMPEVEIRENFAKTLAFEPFLRSGKDGKAELKFRTSDQLSTFNVRLYAHDKSMRNAYLAREMVVSIPVKVSVTEPKYLYVGDKYDMAVNVSSNADAPISGTMFLYQYAGKDYQNSEPVKVSSFKIMVPARASVSHSFEVAVPENAEQEIGLKAAFVADGFSDGLFVSVPVYETSQILTEAHSAVILPGMDKEAELEKIRKAFVNTSYHGAEYKEISIIDMVKEAIPTMVEPESEDVISLSEAYYVRKVAESLGVVVSSELSNEKLVEKIAACRNADGGYGWFEGMNSSPVLTAVLLERFAKLRDAGLGDEGVALKLDSAVKYLDDSYFRVDWPFWCGGISMEQYLFVRSLYPSVEFDPKDSGNDFAKRMKEFKKDVKTYLVPKSERGLNGQILEKARRLRTLSELVSSDEGIVLANKWGVALGAKRRMLSSLADDVVSLKEYAADHKDGGMYYPNAVMPFRGLLESEAYAHSMICDLFTDYAGGFGGVVPAPDAAKATRIADGIRIWLMLQKETQKWGEEPAFVDALNSIMAGSDEVKATKVILMTKTYEKPFREIKAAGNGFSIERKFFLNDEEIAPGAVLKVGDRVRIEYKIWNDENRSFVLLRAPREATLRPVQQLSGMYGWGIRPLRVGNWFSFQPHGYRNVKSARTEFYFDTYPEESTTISEEFYVIQAGTFNAPVVEIESLYAPHYRANVGYEGAIEVVSGK